VHGIIEPASTLGPSVGYPFPQIFYWLFELDPSSFTPETKKLVTAVNYGFRTFTALNVALGLYMTTIITYPLLKKRYFTPEEFGVVVKFMGWLLFADVFYSLASLLAKAEYPDVSVRVFVPVAMDCVLIVSKVVFGVLWALGLLAKYMVKTQNRGPNEATRLLAKV
jgi:pheromone shutdown protein TraB